MEYITYKYEGYDDKESACESFIWDYFADYIPSSIGPFINYTGIVEKVLELEVLVKEGAVYILSKEPVSELRL